MQTFRISAIIAALAGLASVSASPAHSFDASHAKLVRRQSGSTGGANSPVEPLTPATTNEGRPLQIEWTPTSNSDWKSMEIKLMTGSNQQMTELATIATGVDGSESGGGKLSWTAPAVEPNARIYFFQFTHDGEEPTWTTRFAIADASGQVVAAPEANQPEGGSPPIPWGEGKLEGDVASTNSTSSSASSSSTSSTSAAATSTTASTPTAAAVASSVSRAPATAATSSGIDYSKFNSGNQPSSASSSLKVASAAVVGSVVFAAAAVLL